jgi:hypothetical protein
VALQSWKHLPREYRERVLDTALREYRRLRLLVGDSQDDEHVRPLLEGVLSSVFLADPDTK